ncbi:MAG: hypothetical protein AB1815_06385 [Bacillota bacterium]
MAVMEFIMRFKKMTDTKVCFKENMDRIGNIYLPFQLLDIINIEDEIIVQLAPDKSFFAPGGYTAQFVREKETEKKVRFAENLGEKGELGIIYIRKCVLESMGIRDEIAVRVVPSGKTGGAAFAR